VYLSAITAFQCSAACAVHFLQALPFGSGHAQVLLLDLVTGFGWASCLDGQSTASLEDCQRAILAGDGC
jgi:hypothetical protein